MGGVVWHLTDPEAMENALDHDESEGLEACLLDILLV